MLPAKREDCFPRNWRKLPKTGNSLVKLLDSLSCTWLQSQHSLYGSCLLDVMLQGINILPTPYKSDAWELASCHGEVRSFASPQPRQSEFDSQPLAQGPKSIPHGFVGGGKEFCNAIDPICKATPSKQCQHCTRPKKARLFGFEMTMTSLFTYCRA